MRTSPERDLLSQTRRLEVYLDELYLVTKTFAALELYEHKALSDTLLSLSTTFLDAESGFVLLRTDGALVPAAASGSIHADTLLADDALAVWNDLLRDKIAQMISDTTLTERWPKRPAAMASGIAAVALDVQDRAIGLLALSPKGGQLYGKTELAFLTGIAGVGALALANATAVQMQRNMSQEIARTEGYKREVAEKARLLEELDQKLAIIERQNEDILALSTPILEIWDHVLALPVIGTIDERRSSEIMNQLLDAVVAKRARFVILDLTGVHQLDTTTADHFIKVFQGVHLLGARGIMTGLRPAVAQTVVQLGVDLMAIQCHRTLREGLRACIGSMAPAAS